MRTKKKERPEGRSIRATWKRDVSPFPHRRNLRPLGSVPLDKDVDKIGVPTLPPCQSDCARLEPTPVDVTPLLGDLDIATPENFTSAIHKPVNDHLNLHAVGTVTNRTLPRSVWDV